MCLACLIIAIIMRYFSFVANYEQLCFTAGIILNDTVSSDHLSTEDSTSFRCRVLCSERSFVIWTVNGTLLRTWPALTYSISSDIEDKCSQEDEADVANNSSFYTEFLEIDSVNWSMLVQCASVYNCDGDTNACMSSVCFSQGSVIRG